MTSAFSIQPSALFLALDTATDRPTLALGTPGEPGRDLVMPHRHDLSGQIDVYVQRLLDERGISPAALSGIVVADGPGSFTGLRIGIAFAKGMARALGIPIIAAPSLLGAASVVSRAGTVVAEYGALRGDVYRAAWRFDSSGISVALPPVLARAGSPAGIETAHRLASENDASAAALLGLLDRVGGPVTIANAASWEPSYGRLAEAEAKLQARDGHA